MIYFKVTKADGSPANGGKGRWPRPTQVNGKWLPGKRWGEVRRPITGDLEPCSNGLHICSASQLWLWLRGTQIWVVRPLGERVRDRSKTVTRDARLLYPLPCWNRTAVLAWLAGLKGARGLLGYAKMRSEILHARLVTYPKTRSDTIPEGFMPELHDFIKSSARQHFTRWVLKHVAPKARGIHGKN